jgi:hypothetical protein
LNWFLLWLYLHITGAVIAFGPTFTFALFGAMVAKEPMHGSFALRLQERITRGIVVPVALTMLVSGIGLLVTAHISLVKTPYMIVAVVLYVSAVSIGIGILIPTAQKMIAIMEAMPKPSGPPPAAIAPAGPPPELAALIARGRGFGMVNSVLILVILFLMIVKPGGVVPGPLFG